MPIKANRLFQTWALHGPSGAGKTTLCATAPKPVFLDSNQGLLSIADVPEFGHVKYVDVRSMESLEEAYDQCSGTTTSKKDDWSKQFSTIVFDHFDDIQGIVLDELIEKAMEKDDRRDDTVEQREYGIMGNKLRRYLRKFKRIPMHKILILGSKVDFDSGQERPSLVGALQHQLPYLVDHTMYLQVKENGKRIIHLNESEHWYAKTRARWLSPEQRKIVFKPDDYTCLTRLFDMVAAGPKKPTSGDTTTPTDGDTATQKKDADAPRAQKPKSLKSTKSTK